MTTIHWTPTTENADQYLGERTGKYEQRATRYRHAIECMVEHGLDDTHTLIDLGAGWTEFDYTLRAEYDWKGRYLPVDAWVDGTDINTWTPPREVDWVVGLEILEHLMSPYDLVMRMKSKVNAGIVFSTPNPRTTDVLGMDETHITEIDRWAMHLLGFTVTEETFYGGRFSNGEPDSLFGYWLANGKSAQSTINGDAPEAGPIKGLNEAIASVMAVGR